MSVVSVLMSVYNGESYVSEAIESILNQTFKDFEYIIIDDFSTDNTLAILQEYACRDQRIKLIQNDKNIGLTKSLNKGLRLAQGKYVARQDADDISFWNRLEIQYDFLEANTDVALVSCNIDVINEEGKMIRKLNRHLEPELILWFITFYNVLGGHSQVVFRRKSILSIGGYNEEYTYCQDYELWSRLVKTSKIAMLNKTLIKYRNHDGRISIKNRDLQKGFSLRITKRNLENILNKSVDLETVKELRAFWKGNFEACKNVKDINSTLNEIYRRFIETTKIQTDGLVCNKIQDSIKRQIYQWSKTVSKKREPLRYLHILFYYFMSYYLGYSCRGPNTQ